ncbi:MAG: CTP synthase [Sphaerochaetaceae bacterium]|nr:CTP synthase [Sphaerochaetaceae bacterium]
MTKYIFVTGGVVSGLGKGITAASLGRLLKNRGLKVAAQKLDPYMNVDPGTMSPLQHGEVFVTEDGAETDLDLGHYERFIDEDLNKYSNLTSGKVYWNVLHKERAGEYLGRTVQIIPHVTDEIKKFIYAVGNKTNADVVITEIGGTVGDIESQPFLEAIRQVGHEVGEQNRLYIHVTLVPYLNFSQEHKSKPTQHSVKEMQSLGIFPDIIVLRSDMPIEESIKDKIAMFCNVDQDCVIENKTLDSLYEVPMMLHEQRVDDIVCSKMRIRTPKCNMTDWKAMCSLVESASASDKNVEIAMVGKYTALHDAYLSVVEALHHAAIYNQCNLSIRWVESTEITSYDKAKQMLDGVKGILVPGGFGDRGIEGMINACRYARETKTPYFGICLGMQIAVIEYGRGVLGWKDAMSSEFDPETKHPVIALMPDQEGVQKGGTMRLGAYPCNITKGTLLEKLYAQQSIQERHRHRYEFNNDFRSEYEAAGLVLCGQSPDRTLVESVEIPQDKHPFFIGVQYHPEFKSRPTKVHPIFMGFVKAALEN